MHSVDDELIFSATDLSNFLACPQLSLLDRKAALGGPKPPKFDDPGLEVLQQRGIEHERQYLTGLQNTGIIVAEIAAPSPSLPSREWWMQFASATADAMRAGADAIYQGALFNGKWVGRVDFLRKVDTPSALGPWSYEVIDTKLARDAKGGALLQVLLYADLLKEIQGVPPEYVHIALGGPEPRTASFRVADYAAYFRSVQRRFLELMAKRHAELPVAAEPVEHCAVCAWHMHCDGERRSVDHLSLVAGISRAQRHALSARRIETVESLAGLPLPVRPRMDGVSDAALERVREQARIQVEERHSGQPHYELLNPGDGEGLAALPPPSPGDLFFDLEGDPYALIHGVEYLFGFVDKAGCYSGWWALERASEKANFQRFIDFVMHRLTQHPDMHIYHYAPYEPTALKKLMGRHGTREDEVDRLLRGEVFVDLYRVVRQGVRASVESYSIKRLEKFYGYARDVNLRSATNALAHFSAWLELSARAEQPAELIQQIEGYNRDDCMSTLRLRNWLEQCREELSNTTGTQISRPEAPDGEASETVAAEQDEVNALVDSLTVDVPADPGARSPKQNARWLLAQLLGWHRREKKSAWWEYFRCLDLTDEELVEDRSTLGGLEYEGVVGTVKRSEVHRYRYPPQEHGLRVGIDVRDPATKDAPGSIVRLDDAAGTVDLKRGKNSTVRHPRALVPFDMIQDTDARASLRRIARSVIECGLGGANPYSAAVDLLLRNQPRTEQPLMLAGETALEAGRRLVNQLDRTVLPIQGPPGAGKTYTAAHMIVEALRAGKRVGITATSHKVISNLLDTTCELAKKAGVPLQGIQKAYEDQRCHSKEIAATEDNKEVRKALDDGTALLAAGTAWLWSRADMTNSVDILFVDEAGQFSLANALAVAPSAQSLVLIGDPRQLEQPQQGVHPPGADASALDHLLSGALTIASDRGLFLAETWRLHPEICAFTSEIFYDGRLRSRDNLERQAICGTEPLNGSGLRLVSVEHSGNTNVSVEEVEVVAGLVDSVLGSTWIDDHGTPRKIELKDILVVAPYNAQVSALAAQLPAGARVGTVDKFQGQQAPIVIYSMTTSSAVEAPRGMGFLYSPNRLNVATSRAKCLAVVVASPRLFVADCRTPEQMRLANAFCRFREMAGGKES